MRVVMIQVTTVVSAAPEDVWADLRDISSHVEWMRDAAEIRFNGPQREGVGTVFDCVTKIGPIRLTDRMEVTEWDDGELMGIRHQGIVTGTGEFRLTACGGSHGEVCTEFAWSEQLRFPWQLGGRFGAMLARPVLKWVWRRNLRAFSRLYTDSPPRAW